MVIFSLFLDCPKLSDSNIITKKNIFKGLILWISSGFKYTRTVSLVLLQILNWYEEINTGHPTQSPALSLDTNKEQASEQKMIIMINLNYISIVIENRWYKKTILIEKL